MSADDARQFANIVLNRRYVLQGVLGKGGMGIVFQAYDRLNRRQVALKRVDATSTIIADESVGTVEYHHLILANEFKVSATLRHPNIVEVFDYGFDDKRIPFFTMELLTSSQTIIEAGQNLPIPERLDLFVQLVQAIGYLHRRNILHRDIKPANVIVVDKRVKVLDFGLSGILERTQHHQDTEEKMLSGTLAYMSPEMLMEQSSTFASDLYSLGLLGYELLLGHHPYDVKDIPKLIDQILYEIPSIEALDVSIDVANIFFRLLQKDIHDRYADADNLLADLEHALQRPIHDSNSRDSLLQAARLVGRDAEMKRLTDYLALTQQQQGGAYLIVGDSGIGKSRVLAEFRTLVLVKDVLVARAHSLEQQLVPYAMWLPILRWFALMQKAPTPQDVAIFATVLGDVSDLFSTDLIQQSSDLQFSHTALQNQLHALIVRQIRQSPQPIVILLEDLHWAGTESLELLQALAQSAPSLPLMLTATTRPHPIIKTYLNDFENLELTTLSAQAIEEMSEAMLGKAGQSPEVIDILQRETNGNAFFVVEILRTLAHQFGNFDQIGRVTLPGRIFVDRMATFVEKYLENINPHERELVYLAALMGRQLNLEILSHLTQIIDIKAWLIAKLNAGLLEVDDDVWHFAHDQILQRIITLIPDEKRTEYHRRIAHALEATYSPDLAPHAVVLSHHWRLADIPEKEEGYATYAGEQYLKIGVYHQSITYLERARSLLGELPIKAERRQKKQVHLLQRIATAHLGLGNYQVAWQYHSDAHEIMQALGDRIGIAVCLAHLGDVALAINELSQALELYQKSLAEYTAMDNFAGMARAYNQLGSIYYEMDDDAASLQAFQQSLTISREIGTEWGMAGSMTQTRQNTANNTDNQTAIDQLELQYELARKQGKLHEAADKLLEIGIILHDASQYDLARAYYRRSLLLRQTLGDHPHLGRLSARIAMLDVREGLYSTAQKRLAYALRILARSQGEYLIPYVYYEIAYLFHQQKQYDTMLEILAFLLNDPQSPESVQDASEQLINELSKKIDISYLESSWERGKTLSSQELFQQFAQSDTE